MSDATNRAKNLLSTLDREDSVSFYAVRGVLKECIAEIETQCTENSRLTEALQMIARGENCVAPHIFANAIVSGKQK
jgi:hypothetical protein